MYEWIILYLLEVLAQVRSFSFKPKNFLETQRISNVLAAFSMQRIDQKKEEIILMSGPFYIQGSLEYWTISFERLYPQRW